MQVSSFNPSDPQHLFYIARKRNAQIEYLAQIKEELQKTIQNINFVDPIQNRRKHEALMNEVNKEVRH